MAAERALSGARAFLARAGYERDTVAALRKEGGDPVLRRLVSLFIDGEAFDVAETESLLGEGVGILVEAGLLRVDATAVRRAVLLVPHEGVLIASDDPEYESADYVTGVQRPAHLAALLTPRRPVASAADIGTGCGILALLAARHADRVVATDVNQRALGFCELNAALNGIGNVETRLGSFLEPLGDERFDLIVSNPPFFVSPSSKYLFRDAGRGDKVSEDLVRGLPQNLADRGHAVVDISWVANEDADLERPRSWAEDTCSAVLVLGELKDAAEDAEAWIRAAGSTDVVGELERWRTWYAANGIVRLAYGAIVLRRDGVGGVTLPVQIGELGSAGEQLLRILDAQERDPNTLVLAPDARFEGSELSLISGLHLVAELGPDAGAVRAALGHAPTEITRQLQKLGFLVEP